ATLRHSVRRKRTLKPREATRASARLSVAALSQRRSNLPRGRRLPLRITRNWTSVAYPRAGVPAGKGAANVRGPGGNGRPSDRARDNLRADDVRRRAFGPRTG